MKLDNAAKIYPSALSWFGWMSLFRLSAELTEKVDPVVLQTALEVTVKRFPTMSNRLRPGVFWYYLDRIETPPVIQPDVNNPCARMNFRRNNGYMFRVRYHENRIAIEFFHVLADGTGGMIFLKTLTAEYLRLKYGAVIPRGNGILDCTEPPRPEECEDSFIRYSRQAKIGLGDESAWHIKGKKENPEYIHVTTAIMSAAQIHAKAKEYNATITEYLTAHLLLSLAEMQKKMQKHGKKLPVKVNLPVNLRKFYPSTTLRNFANYMNIGLRTDMGDYTFEEAVESVRHQTGLLGTEKVMNARFSGNVNIEKKLALRVVPLFLKNPVMKLGFKLNGDRQSTTTLTNLGRVVLPQEMNKYVRRLDFLLGPMSENRIVCACVSVNDVLCLNFTRSIDNTDFERLFLTRLVKDGIKVRVETNRNQSEL